MPCSQHWHLVKTSQTIRGSIKDTVPNLQILSKHHVSDIPQFWTGRNKIHTCTNFILDIKITPKDKIEIKVATWRLFEPMGIPWGPYKMQESEAYPGRLKESGIGITYQRILWKGLFTQIEILPLWKTYLDENKNKIDDGFKLYTSYTPWVPCTIV